MSSRQRIDSILLPALERMKACRRAEVGGRTGTAVNVDGAETLERPTPATTPAGTGDERPQEPQEPQSVVGTQEVSRRTYEKWRVIRDRAPEQLANDVLHQRRSIESVYQQYKRTHPAPPPESATAPLASTIIAQVVALTKALQQSRAEFASWPGDQQARLRDAIGALNQEWQAFEAGPNA